MEVLQRHRDLLDIDGAQAVEDLLFQAAMEDKVGEFEPGFRVSSMPSVVAPFLGPFCAGKQHLRD